MVPEVDRKSLIYRNVRDLIGSGLDLTPNFYRRLLISSKNQLFDRSGPDVTPEVNGSR